jgi:hypothetical protein
MKAKKQEEIGYEEAMKIFKRKAEFFGKEQIKREALFKVKSNMRSRFRLELKRYKETNCDSMGVMIGCTWAFFDKWITSQLKRGMSWKNHGSVWHIDHITPLAAFDLYNNEHIQRAWHYTNLRPLRSKENMQKADKIITHQPELMIEMR